MISWHVAYTRLKNSPEFIRYFGGPKEMPPYAFRPLHFMQRFTVGSAAESPPTNQNFPAGAIILGITAAAFQVQTAAGAFQYAPSPANPGRRDLFGLSFQYTNDELITPDGPGSAEALLGGGSDTIFPARELLIAPSQGILATVENLTVGLADGLTVDIVYHSMVPRAVG